MEERLQKIMAQAGLGSRRACEELIATGRVSINGKRAELGQKADPNVDRILVDGVPLKAPENYQYIALYKPRNVLTTVEAPDPRQTVRDLVSIPGTLYPVGRLDVDSEGLVLLTNDGDLANRLTHPRYQHEKEYKVLVARRPDDQQLETWRRGVVLEDGHRTLPAQVIFISAFGQGAWLKIILREGRKRQIREIGTLIGLPVVRIIRFRIGSLYLGRLKPGEWRRLTPGEISELKGITLPEMPAKRYHVRKDRQVTRTHTTSRTTRHLPTVHNQNRQPSAKNSNLNRSGRKTTKPNLKK
jgi:23S rRNA pseudouridine2605 synthase